MVTEMSVYQLVRYDINVFIEQFRVFLKSTHLYMEKHMETHEWDADLGSLYLAWGQANWEVFVERRVLALHQYLGPYIQMGCRYSSPHRKPTHMVVCGYRGKDPDWKKLFADEIIVFGAFVAKLENCAAHRYPFDFVSALSLKTDEKVVVPCADVYYTIQTVPET